MNRVIIVLLSSVCLLSASLIGGVDGESLPGTLVELRAVDADMFTRIGPPPEFYTSLSPSATFIVHYNNFPVSAQAAFQHAVNIWSALIESPVAIRVRANWVALSSNVLGSAGASEFRRDFLGAPQPGTWYPIPLADKLRGTSINHPDSADIIANFNSNLANWYFGTDGNTPSGQFDFVTVVLHELGHGLGFVGSMTVSNGQGGWGFSTGFPFIYDRFADNGSGQQLINTTLFPNPSTALATQLTSNNIFFNGPNAVAANGGNRPKLYAPATWQEGSSYSHLDEATYPAGNPNSLMTPAIGTAEAIHSPGPISLGMFKDWGWTVTTSVEQWENDLIPDRMSLSQNYPNPFNPRTTIGFQVAEGGDQKSQVSRVMLRVYDLLGREVAMLVDEELKPGSYEVVWDPVGLASGVYFYQLRAGGFVETKRLMLMR